MLTLLLAPALPTLALLLLLLGGRGGRGLRLGRRLGLCGGHCGAHSHAGTGHAGLHTANCGGQRGGGIPQQGQESRCCHKRPASAGGVPAPQLRHLMCCIIVAEHLGGPDSPLPPLCSAASGSMVPRSLAGHAGHTAVRQDRRLHKGKGSRAESYKGAARLIFGR